MPDHNLIGFNQPGPATPLQQNNNPAPARPGPQQTVHPTPSRPGLPPNDPAAQLRAAQRGRVNLARQQLSAQQAESPSSARQREEEETREIAARGQNPLPHEGQMVSLVLARHPRFSTPATIKFSVLSDQALSTLIHHPEFGNSEYGKEVKRLAQNELERREFAREDLNEDFSPESFATSPADMDVLKALQEAVAKIPNDPLLGGKPFSHWKPGKA